MYALMVLFTVVYVIACTFLIFVVLIQKGEGGGLGGAFGGGAVDVAFGAKADMTWKRATAICASLFMLLAMLLGVLHHQLDQRSLAEEAKRRQDEAEKAAAPQQTPGGAPGTPGAATPGTPGAPGAGQAPGGTTPENPFPPESPPPGGSTPPPGGGTPPPGGGTPPPEQPPPQQPPPAPPVEQPPAPPVEQPPAPPAQPPEAPAQPPPAQPEAPAQPPAPPGQ